MHLSHCWCRMSDKQIVKQSDLIDFLLPGDVIIADRGFTCDDYACMALAKVKNPHSQRARSSSLQNSMVILTNKNSYLSCTSVLALNRGIKNVQDV